MKLDGVKRERVQDTSLIKTAVNLRKTVDSRWRIIYRPLYFVFTIESGETYDYLDLHDWEKELLPDSLVAILKLTNEKFIVGISMGKFPHQQEDFSTNFVSVLSMDVEISRILYHVEAYGPKKDK
jgi:hypothetical protein